MSFYAIEVRIHGTVYIKASTQEKAEQILERLRSKTIDARHRVWFTEAPFEYVPRVSFATSFTADARLPGAKLIKVPERYVDLSQRSFVLGSRDIVVPFAECATKFNEMPVFASDADVTTTAFIQAESIEEAEVTMTKFNSNTHIDLQMQYWRWFSKLGLDKSQKLNPPIVLSSALQFVGPSECLDLEQRSPK
jgi:hypothetical protein